MNVALTQQGYENVLFFLTWITLVALLGSIILGVLAIRTIREHQPSTKECPKCSVSKELVRRDGNFNLYRQETTAESLGPIRRSALLGAKERQGYY